MIVIKIELWPQGNKERARLIGEGRICNEGGTMQSGNYSVNLLRSPEYAKPGNVGKSWRKGKVEGFPRLKLGPWDLLLRALVSAVGKRNPRDEFDAMVLNDFSVYEDEKLRPTRELKRRNEEREGGDGK